MNPIKGKPFFCSWSGGKDSCLALYLAIQNGAIPKALLTMLQEDGEKSPLGIVICADKQSEQIELLELEKSNIHVAQYLTVLPPRELLEKKLHEAVINARLRFENRAEE